VTVTERELSAALARTGRHLPLGTIREWRVAGLLPAIESRSLGARKGKVCYWPDESVCARASLIYDLRRNGVRKHHVVWLLWLCGLSLPLPGVRRAWSQQARTQDYWTARDSDAAPLDEEQVEPASPRKPRRNGGSRNAHSQFEPLLQVALTACASFDGRHDVEVDALISAFDAVGVSNAQFRRRFAAFAESRRQSIVGLKMAWSTVRASNLINVATDDELRDAQRYAIAGLHYAKDHVKNSRGIYSQLDNPLDLPIACAERFGAPLFFLVLTMLRSNQREQLDFAMQVIERPLASYGCRNRPPARAADSPAPLN
jgi:hypothetical protein